MTASTDPKLKEMLDQFVRVRLVQMGSVDLSLFQFDPFLSWSVFFMNGDKTIYGRFGVASPSTNRNRKDSNPCHSLEGLVAALRRVLDIHAEYTANPASWSDSLAGKVGPKPHWPTPASMPSSLKYRRLKRIKGANQEGCFHCHEVQRGLIDSYFMTERKLPDNLLWVYPQPEILGITLSRDHCARVVEVAEDSFAARAGLKPGDDIESMAGQPLVSVADVQWVLHTFPDVGGQLPMKLRRQDNSVTVRLLLPKLWRRAGDFGWRYRVAGYSMWMWGGVSIEDSPRGVRVSAPSPDWFDKPNRDARQKLRRGDVIVAVDGKTGWTRSTYLAYLMRNKKLGATVRLKVERGGKITDVAFEIPTKRPEILGY